jgi:hypothetical protein
MYGMFAPSFFSGFLIKNCGLPSILLAGLLLSSTVALIGLSGGTMEHFLFANIGVGCGWNFVFVGATHLLTTMYHPEENDLSFSGDAVFHPFP